MLMQMPQHCKLCSVYCHHIHAGLNSSILISSTVAVCPKCLGANVDIIWPAAVHYRVPDAMNQVEIHQGNEGRGIFAPFDGVTHRCPDTCPPLSSHMISRHKTIRRHHRSHNPITIIIYLLIMKNAVIHYFCVTFSVLSFSACVTAA